MPLYLCVTDTKSISLESKEKLAKGFTDIHCGLTFAPPSFVHVYFIDAPADDNTNSEFTVLGNIRADRSESVKNQIIDRMCTLVSSVLKFDREKVAMTISESPGSWTMEGGHLLPEPGEEDAWMQRHYEMLAEHESKLKQ